MKILYYVEEKDNLMFRWQESHFIDELSRYGIIIEMFNCLKFSNPKEANTHLLKRVDDGEVDLFMTPLNEKQLSINTIEKIKSKSIPTLLICFDNLVVPFFHKVICKHFDLVWLTSFETEYLFKRWGARTLFMPYAANPYLFEPKDDHENEFEKICFIGSPYGSRINTINTLLNNKVKVDVYSTYQNKVRSGEVPEKQKAIKYIRPLFNLIKFSYGRKIILGAVKNKLIKQKSIKIKSDFLTLRKPIMLHDLGQAYNKYALSLSSTSARNTGVLKKPLEIVNLRSFEIPMSGGIQVCKYNAELAEYFKDGEEIIFYRDDLDMVNKVIELLKPENKQLRDRIKKSARLKAETNHSWIARFDVIFDYFGIKY